MEAEWERSRAGRETVETMTATGALRTALLFGSAAVAIALLAAPALENRFGARYAAASNPGLDMTSTGSIARSSPYTVRRSVLQSSPEAICVIRGNGTRSGDC